MRKLMTAVAAATTSLFAFGEVGDFTHTGFEASPYVADGVLNTQLDDAGLADGQTGFAKVWEGYDAGTNASTVVKAYDNDAPVIDGKTAGSNYLYVETDEAPVTRYVKEGAAAETIGSNGVYLDTLVKFTPMDADDEASLATTDGDKIAIALVGNETTGTTNFVVRAGYIEGSSITPTNYTMNAVAENFDYSAWHRLTVEAISNVGNENAPVGFVVYVDGTMLTYSTDVAAGDSAYVGSFNAVVSENLYTSSTHALLPSLVDANAATCGTLASVSFKGQGSVDDIEFTATRPTVLPDFGTNVTIAWGEGVATVKIGDDEAFATADLDYASTNITVDADVTSLAVVATYAEGKEAGEWTASAGTFANGTWTGFSTGATLTIVAKTPYFEVNGETFESFDDAVNEAIGATDATRGVVKLISDYTGGITLQNAGFITIDLAGKTITGETDAPIYVDGEIDLYITNSTAVAGHVVAPEGAEAVYLAGGTTTIFGGVYDGGDVFIDGGDLTVCGGKFYDKAYAAGDATAFYLTANVDRENYTISDADENNYFTVSSGVTPEPTEIDVPTAVSDLVYDGTVLTGVVENVGYTLSGNTATDAGNYTATATLADGYVWKGGSTDATNINWSIAANANAEVTVTLTSVIAEYSAQLEFPTASATIGGDAVAGTPTWNPAEITEPNAGETNTYTVTFTVTTPNYAESTGTATFKVWKAESEEPVYPSYIDNITDPEQKAAYEAKYSTWATTYSVADGAGNEEAFLLNCAPANVETAKANFKIPSITVDAQGNVTVGTIEGTFNGKLQLKGSTDLSTWTNLNAASKDYNFFKYELTY